MRSSVIPSLTERDLRNLELKCKCGKTFETTPNGIKDLKRHLKEMSTKPKPKYKIGTKYELAAISHERRGGVPYLITVRIEQIYTGIHGQKIEYGIRIKEVLNVGGCHHKYGQYTELNLVSYALFYKKRSYRGSFDIFEKDGYFKLTEAEVKVLKEYSKPQKITA